MLEGYCVSYARWLEALAHVEEHGIVVLGAKGGLVKNPAVTVANEALVMMHKFASELGMSPASRTRLKVETPKNEPTLVELLFDGVKANQNE
jgi:P27 family predicted phage terminase small subunit